MSRRGRKPTLDERKKNEILAVLSTGCSWETAATYVHCHPNTIRNTALRDPDFAQKLGRMRKSAEIAHLANINRAGKQPNLWRASAWFLERTNPGGFANQKSGWVQAKDIEQIIAISAEAILEEVPPARYRKAIIKRLRRVAEDFALGDESLREIAQKLDEETSDFPEDTKLLAHERPKNEENDGKHRSQFFENR